MISGVILDYGQVLSLPQPAGALPAMAEVLGVDVARVYDAYWALRLQYDRGDLEGHTYWREVAARCGTSVGEQGIARLLHLDGESWTLPNAAMVAWVESALRAGVPVALLSNMPAEVRDHILRRCEWLPRFVHATFSCDLHVVKPDSEIYEACARGMGLPVERLLFVDDRPANVEGARRAGMRALHFEDTEGALLELERAFAVR